MPAPFAVPGHAVVRLGRPDATTLQGLWERCSAFHELQEGEPTRPTAGADELAALPPGMTEVDKFAFGFFGPGGDLVAYLDLVRDYPGGGEWSLGLLLVAPEARGRGLGRRIYRAAAGWAAAEGAAAIVLGVLEQNPAAKRFWQGEGFVEVRRQRHVAATGHESWIAVMRHALAEGEPL